jgi:excisionase family DNA binding protein
MNETRQRTAAKKAAIEKKYAGKAAVAARYATCPSTIEKWMRKRVLPFIKIGRLVRFDLEACDRAILAFEVRSAVAVQEGVDNHAA